MILSPLKFENCDCSKCGDVDGNEVVIDCVFIIFPFLLSFPDFLLEIGEVRRGEYLLLTSLILESITVRKPREACESAVKLGNKNLPVL